ncbi:Lycopene beta cyclase, chloroplastic [Gracilariopsis chorda]|uniref:lycopene beta-cyclase n=2 Tax=Gracilariopsis TaxID=2781 RepID=A0A2V3IVV7_9FLOR|nr:lycopene beta-cyclase [Gracilariopsis lemaneiformis]PXF46251.1 Lycopene beta cyclase, chloroplastic [Gracilariopsis chorda]|eukprot:PXF46251.1 Lycopene beta cyclase, chloroplastic [Gracilariopsis chorda]
MHSRHHRFSFTTRRAFVPVVAPASAPAFAPCPLLSRPARRLPSQPKRSKRVSVSTPLCAQSSVSSAPVPVRDTERPPQYDVVVIGAGPAGLSLASALAKRRLRVFCADARLHERWPNNYGTWLDELQPLGLQDCVSHVWQRTAAFVRADGKKSSLPRAYVRVDRDKLKERFLNNCAHSGNVTLAPTAVQHLQLDRPDLNFVHLQAPTDNGADIVAARLVVDATGHSLTFVNVPDGATPGYQAAYGIECIVSDKGYPYHSDEMLLMDFRDDHMQTPQDKRQSNQHPTFIYVMPMDSGKGRHVFFEETSLVASPAMDFGVLKERLHKRLDYYGVKVEQLLEEEFCLIPMGGEMPNLDQRVVAFGGAAAFVHPATGYMIARALKLSEDVADIIADELSQGGQPDLVSRRIWSRIWNEGRRRQRDFFNFGGEYLQHIDLQTTRDFFAAFFDLPTQQWADFLSFRMIKPLERLFLGVGVFVRTSNRVRVSLIKDAITKGRLSLLTSVLPLYSVDPET